MMDNILMNAKYVALLVASMFMQNWIYFFLVGLTFAFNYWYRQKYEIKLTGGEWVKLFFVGGATSLVIFDGLTGQVDSLLAKAGAAAFLTALAIEVAPVLIKVAKDIAPAYIKKQAGVKDD